MNEPARTPEDLPPSVRSAAARLALGTAQFGLDYGVSNAAGQTTLAQAAQIVAEARAAGCTTIDTAIAYGQAEERLGEVGVAGWDLVSKLPAIPADCADVDAWVRAQVKASLQRLGVAQLDALLLHAPAQLTGPHGAELSRALLRLKADGLARRLGVSIYAPGELGSVLAAFPVEVVQAPFNVMDRGLETTGWARRLQERGIEIHLRSAFLQGLLLMEAGARPAYFSPWQGLWDRWHAWLAASGQGALQACLSYSLSRPFASRVVVGVTSPEQWREVLAAAGSAPVAPPDDLQCGEAGLINPAQWKLK